MQAYSDRLAQLGARVLSAMEAEREWGADISADIADYALRVGLAKLDGEGFFAVADAEALADAQGGDQAEHHRMARLKNAIESLHWSMVREHRMHADGIQGWSDLCATADWARCTERTREYLRGFADGLYAARWGMVQFAYVTPRGIVKTHDNGPAGVLCRLTADECRNADAFPRGYIWSTTDRAGDVAWFTPPEGGAQ